MNDDEITIVETGEMCPHCDWENEISLDYREVVKVLKGEDANLPLVHCEDCGKRIAPCSLCMDAVNDGYITEDEQTCDNCPILAHWDKSTEKTSTKKKRRPS